MAGGYQESHEVLRKHGGTVHGLTDRLQGALDAARLVSMPADAYGILCQPFARLLNPLEDAGLDVLDGGVEGIPSYGETWNNVAAELTAIQEDLTDAVNSELSGWTGDEDSATRPNLCWRRSTWNRDVDHEQLAEVDDLRAYLTGDTQISSIIAFTRMAAQPALTDLIERTITAFSRCVTITAAERTDMPWQALRLDIADERLIYTIDYSPLLVQSELVETWAQTWIEYLDTLDPHGAIAPDADISVSYRRSLPEMLAVR